MQHFNIQDIFKLPAVTSLNNVEIPVRKNCEQNPPRQEMQSAKQLDDWKNAPICNPYAGPKELYAVENAVVKEYDPILKYVSNDHCFV